MMLQVDTDIYAVGLLSQHSPSNEFFLHLTDLNQSQFACSLKIFLLHIISICLLGDS